MLQDVFNCDETAVFFKQMPNETYNPHGEKCSGGKVSKDRVTVFLSCSANGSEKQPALVLGKSKNPHCFKNVKSLPCDYKSTLKVWMTSDVLVSFLHGWGSMPDNRSVLLLLHRCSAHPTDFSPPLLNIKLQFFPPNTSKLQPLDQSIIHSLKVHYRRKIVQYLLFALDHVDSTKLANIDLLKAIHNIAAS